MDTEGDGPQRALTEVEYELLLTALESGYFEEPSRVSTADLADQLNSTRRETVARLSRALAKLFRANRETIERRTEGPATLR
jgi:predicted DNA binding protein